MYEDALPVTGAGGLLIGGHTIGLPWFITVAAGLIVAGVVIYRVSTRARRNAARG